MGVMVEAGIVKEGTPLCVPSKDVSTTFFCYFFHKFSSRMLNLINTFYLHLTKSRKMKYSKERCNILQTYPTTNFNFPNNILILYDRIWKANTYLYFQFFFSIVVLILHGLFVIIIINF